MSRQLKGAIITMIVGFLFVGAEFQFKAKTSLAGIFILGTGAGLLLGDRMGRRRTPHTPPVQPL